MHAITRIAKNCKTVAYCGGVTRTTSTKRILIKTTYEALLLAENLRSARCSPVVFCKVLASRKTNLITARARKKPALLACSQKMAKTFRYPLYPIMNGIQ